MNMKKEFRTFIKNLYKFERYFWTKKSFIGPLHKLRKEIGVPSRDKFLGYANHCKTLQEVKERNKKAWLQRQGYANKVGEQKIVEIMRKIQKILEDNNLGREWGVTILDYLISGWLCPPMYNLYFSEKCEIGKKSIVLELNQDTSLDDLKEAWPAIRKIQRQAWPKYRKINTPSNKALETLCIYRKSIELKYKKRKRGEKLIRLLFPEREWMPSVEGKLKDKRRQNRLKQIIHRLKG